MYRCTYFVGQLTFQATKQCTWMLSWCSVSYEMPWYILWLCSSTHNNLDSKSRRGLEINNITVASTSSIACLVAPKYYSHLLQIYLCFQVFNPMRRMNNYSYRIPPINNIMACFQYPLHILVPQEMNIFISCIRPLSLKCSMVASNVRTNNLSPRMNENFTSDTSV